ASPRSSCAGLLLSSWPRFAEQTWAKNCSSGKCVRCSEELPLLMPLLKLLLIEVCKARRALETGQGRCCRSQVEIPDQRSWQNRLSQLERGALIERHCELFGTWPN